MANQLTFPFFHNLPEVYFIKQDSEEESTENLIEEQSPPVDATEHLQCPINMEVFNRELFAYD